MDNINCYSLNKAAKEKSFSLHEIMDFFHYGMIQGKGIGHFEDSNDVYGLLNRYFYNKYGFDAYKKEDTGE